MTAKGEGKFVIPPISIIQKKRRSAERRGLYTGSAISSHAFLVRSSARPVIGSQTVDGCRRDPRQPVTWLVKNNDTRIAFIHAAKLCINKRVSINRRNDTLLRTACARQPDPAQLGRNLQNAATFLGELFSG